MFYNVVLIFERYNFLLAGTALYVFFITANQQTDTTTFVNTTFFIDGEFAGDFVHVPNALTSDFDFNVSAFATQGLQNTQHTLLMSSDNTTSTNILFDYLMYT